MPDIYHNFIINAPAAKVFDGICTTKGLDNWWTKSSRGEPVIDSVYHFDFGPGYQWNAIVSKCKTGEAFEWIMTGSDKDWLGTKVGFILNLRENITEVSFYHTGWPENNEHYRISCYCWAMYLRILKRNLEFGETVPYEQRLDV